MPEGDTIFRTATVLRPAILHQVIERAESETIDVEPLTGRTIERVEPRGKHLLMHLSGGGAIHSHMGMTGSWHVYLPEQPWRKPARLAALALYTTKANAVCFTPKTLEWLSPDALRRHRWLRMLGPDILDVDFDLDETLRRLRIHNDAPLGEAIMNQSVVCGIGNVYKSECLFQQKLHPFAPVSQFDDRQLRELIKNTRRWMMRNLEGRRRTRTGRDGGSKWVYGRGGEPCFTCGRAIEMQRQGDLGRSTYWCPACQAPQ